MKTFIAIAVAGLAVGSASAQDRVVIDYTSTDLTTSAGAGALYTRILHAADAVCPQGRELGLNSHFNTRKCARAAVAQAVEEVDNPLLTARHRDDARGTLYSR